MTLILICTLLYVFIILGMIYGLMKMITKNKLISKSSSTKLISVIIACKNEQDNIALLIDSLKKQSYHNYEVWLCDDHSTDQTATIIKENIIGDNRYHYVYIPSDFSTPYQKKRKQDLKGKKKALSYGIDKSKGAILAFTDGDCLPGPEWLSDINNCFKNNLHNSFYAGYSPLIFPQANFVTHLKNLEKASIFAVCAGSFGLHIPITCTARNIAYSKSLWEKVQGFNGIGHILSGDDDLMLLKMRKHIQNYFFSFHNTAIIPTREKLDLQKQLHQDTRRGSKFIYYPLALQSLILFITIYYLLILYNLWMKNFTFNFYLSLILKINCEFIFIFIFLKKFNRLYYLKTFIIAELLYIPYYLFFGIKGTFGKYHWK